MSTKDKMELHQIRPNKNYGQNFITDTNLIRKLVSLSNVDKESIVVEIGPGLGILTKELAKEGEKVLAYEIDKRLVEVLNEEFAGVDNVVIHHQDFLELDLVKALDEYKDKKLVVCANLPYYITTPILFKIFESKVNILSISAMMQKEVAERFSAKVNTKNYNALTVITNFKYETKIILKVPKTVFKPQPKVDSAVVLFTRKKALPDINIDDFFKFVKNCFKQPRKTLYNNIREFLDDELAIDIIKLCNQPDNVRPFQLTLEDYLELYKNYAETSTGKN